MLVGANTAKKTSKAKLQAVVGSNIFNPHRCLWLFLFPARSG